MLAIAISLLFGAAAVAAIAVIQASIAQGARHARLILAELAGQPQPVARVSPRGQTLPALPAAA
jgi:hypothetical protein